MRTIDTHKVNPANDTLTITVTDGPGDGGACHSYEISGYNAWTNLSDVGHRKILAADHKTYVLFQNGPISEVGVNGITHEALIAILIDRLQSFQAGPFATRENALALTKLEEAQHWLFARTRSRMARGVEGTHQK
jgi:hypothetical protein